MVLDDPCVSVETNKRALVQGKGTTWSLEIPQNIESNYRLNLGKQISFEVFLRVFNRLTQFKCIEWGKFNLLLLNTEPVNVW